MLTQKHLRRLCRARDQLRQATGPDDSIDAAARTALMSRFHFIRQFNALFGETPGQFRTRARLERAKQLLASGTESVTDVCMAVGFSSLGSFSARFRARFGYSPQQFRQRVLGTGRTRAPGCMELLRAAWETQAHNSRSDVVPK
ncbi:MAG: helix-turn-helix transcriptional regulator [Pseudomonadota bacterium]